MRLTSPAFEDGSPLSPRFARDGDDLNPPLHFLDIPDGTASLLLIMEDIDSPLGSFTHWVVWNIDPRVSFIEEGRLPDSCEVGLNGFGTLGYTGLPFSLILLLMCYSFWIALRREFAVRAVVSAEEDRA